jgi:hypothetical protein
MRKAKQAKPAFESAEAALRHAEFCERLATEQARRNYHTVAAQYAWAARRARAFAANERFSEPRPLARHETCR